MTKDEIIRLPVITSVFQKIHYNQSTCGICGLPWEVCGIEEIEITDDHGVFYICPYCFKKSGLEKVLEATALGYLGQYESITNQKDREYFVKTHDLEVILEKTKEKYIKLQKRD